MKNSAGHKLSEWLVFHSGSYACCQQKQGPEQQDSKTNFEQLAFYLSNSAYRQRKQESNVKIKCPREQQTKEQNDHVKIASEKALVRFFTIQAAHTVRAPYCISSLKNHPLQTILKYQAGSSAKTGGYIYTPSLSMIEILAD